MTGRMQRHGQCTDGRLMHYSYDEGHKVEGRVVYAHELWTVSWSVGGDFGAVSSSYSLKCTVPLSLTLDSHGRVNDFGAYRAIAHWSEGVVRMACRCVESCGAKWHLK